MSDDWRKGAGWSLFVLGVFTTVPLAITVLGNQKKIAAQNITTNSGHAPSRWQRQTAQ